MLHPYHNYITLIDRDLDIKINKMFLDKIDLLKSDLEKAENQVNLQEAKNGSQEYKKFHLYAITALENAISVVQQAQESWNNKKVRRAQGGPGAGAG